jgi:hypothetical protein
MGGVLMWGTSFPHFFLSYNFSKEGLGMKVFLLCVLALYCSASVAFDPQQQLVRKDVDTKIDAELQYFKTNPTKAKNRFSSLLSKLGSRKSLTKVQKVTAKQIKSNRKVKNSIARRFLRMIRKRRNTGDKGKVSSFSSGLEAKMSSTVTQE